MAQQGNEDALRIESRDRLCWVGEDGIARLSFAPGTNLDLELAKAATESFREAVGDRLCPLLVSLDGPRNISREARAYLATVSGPTAVGLVVRSPVARVIGAMLIGLMKGAPYSARVFATEEAATEWLRTHLP